MWNSCTKAKLKAWLGLDTWFKNHPHDDERFYDFIGAVWSECGSFWDEPYAREVITREVKDIHSDCDEDFLKQEVNERVSKGSLILDFLVHMKKKGNQL